jgi:hypothetical protein
MKKHEAFLSLLFFCFKQRTFTKCEEVDVMYLQMHLPMLLYKQEFHLKGLLMLPKDTRIHVNAIQVRIHLDANAVNPISTSQGTGKW